MRDLMISWLNTMLYSGCICGFLLYICPAGKIRDLLETGAVCIMLLSFLSPMGAIRSTHSGELLSRFSAAVEQQELELEKSADSLRESLIREEYEAYICSEAMANGVALEGVRVVTSVSKEGYPLPVAVIYYSDNEVPEAFKTYMAAQLGVAMERQSTYESEGADEAMAGGAEEQ